MAPDAAAAVGDELAQAGAKPPSYPESSPIRNDHIVAALLATHDKRTAIQQRRQVTAHGSPKRAGTEYVAGAVRHITHARAKADARAQLAAACRSGHKVKGACASSDDESSVLMDSATEIDSTDGFEADTES
eukprot:2410531-Prymnesium_polylepis.1